MHTHKSPQKIICAVSTCSVFVLEVFYLHIPHSYLQLATNVIKRHFGVHIYLHSCPQAFYEIKIIILIGSGYAFSAFDTHLDQMR